MVTNSNDTSNYNEIEVTMVSSVLQRVKEDTKTTVYNVYGTYSYNVNGMPYTTYKMINTDYNLENEANAYAKRLKRDDNQLTTFPVQPKMENMQY